MSENTKNGPYEACSTGKDTKPYTYGVKGPGDGLGYHAWYLYPENTFETFEEAEKAARLMNLSFAQGQRARSQQIKALLE